MMLVCLDESARSILLQSGDTDVDTESGDVHSQPLPHSTSTTIVVGQSGDTDVDTESGDVQVLPLLHSTNTTIVVGQSLVTSVVSAEVGVEAKGRYSFFVLGDTF